MIISSAVSGALAIGLMLMIGLAITYIVGARSLTLAPCLSSYGLHVSVSAFLLYFVGGLGAIGPDAYTYHNIAVELSQTIGADNSAFGISEGKEGWLYVLAALYYVFGPTPEIGLVVIATLMAIVPAIMASASRRMGWESSAMTAAWFAVLLPSMIIWPASVLREGPSIFLLSLMVLAVGMYRSGKLLTAGLLLLASTVAMMWIRPPMGIAAIIGIALAVLLIPGRRGRGTFSALWFLAPAALALPFGLIRGAKFDLTVIANLRQNLSDGASTSTGASIEGFDTTGGTLLGMLRDLPGAAFGPFPWQAFSQPWQLAVDGLTFIGLAVLAFAAVQNWRTRRAALTLILPAIAILLVVSAAFGNFGFVVRQRSQATPFLVPVAAAGWVLLRQRRAGTQALYPATTDHHSHV